MAQEYAEINGAQIAYEIIGNGNTAVVCINGIGMTYAHWLPMIQNMGDSFRFLIHDTRGQLKSSKDEEVYSLEGHADDLAELMRATDFTAAHIVGTSYGSEIGMIFAATYPELTLSLTAIDGVSELDPVLETAVESWKTAALVDPATYFRTLIPWNYSGTYIQENREQLMAREKAVAALPKDFFQAFTRLCDAFLKINITELLTTIRCPALVMVADQDIIKPLKFSEIIHSKLPDSRLQILPGLGHACVIEGPQAVAEKLNEFLTEIT